MEKKTLVRQFRLNPLGPVFYALSDFLVTPSAEAIEIARSKTSSRSSSPKKKARVSQTTAGPHHESVTPHELIRIPQSSQLISPSKDLPSTPVGKKRVISTESNESYGKRSTETTPTKISHAESLTQALQNTLIATVINQVWLGGANIPWAQNRKMYLDYRP